MADRLTAGSRDTDCPLVADITVEALDGKTARSRRPAKGDRGHAAGHERTDERSTQESRGTRDEDPHAVFIMRAAHGPWRLDRYRVSAVMWRQYARRSSSDCSIGISGDQPVSAQIRRQSPSTRGVSFGR